MSTLEEDLQREGTTTLMEIVQGRQIEEQTADLTINGTDSFDGKITREDIELPQDFKGKLAFVLYNVFTTKECEEYIAQTEVMGYEEALVNVGGGRQVKMTDVRKSSRCIWDTVEEADRIWERIKSHVPEMWRDRKVLELNERLRFLRYDPGDYFQPHLDGAYVRDNGERSYITVQVYLNQGFKGGSTTFMSYSCENKVELVPKTGSVLVFQHDIMHEGSRLEEGRKYTIRTDVMYSAKQTET
ncbi:uncharacterized protein LOC127880202 [Dreissena polymorpha]|uniref:Prolyl 4-hydroxylase alpha subunit domain-containing protein n=1 Tax=Dreissena polymorpha TaxID=45954 RepID=A0A9D4KEZ0_DREPO|nr:uncharacterized protein LOC127880202 [Dreissena polymorpha]KAH3838628.1 hypothetical protein DPMN_112037 [Dreissena polymorpha]